MHLARHSYTTGLPPTLPLETGFLTQIDPRVGFGLLAVKPGKLHSRTEIKKEPPNATIAVPWTCKSPTELDVSTNASRPPRIARQISIKFLGGSLRLATSVPVSPWHAPHVDWVRICGPLRATPVTLGAEGVAHV